MAVIDLTQARTRAGMRLASLALLSAALAWTAFITARYARDAYRVVEQYALVDGLRPGSELQVILLAAAAAVAPGVFAWLFRPKALPALEAIVLAAALAAMGVLTATSGQVEEVLVFAGLMAWSWFAGRPLLRVMDRKAPIVTGWPRVAVEASLGLAVLSFSVLGLALVGALRDAGIIALLIVIPFAAAFLHFATGRARPTEDRVLEADARLDAVEYVALALLAVTLTVSFGASLAPQTHFDALHYHFAMPRIFLAEGRFVERPDIIQGYFPLGLEMTYVPALRFGGESTMTLLHWAMAPMTAALLWGAGNRFFGRPAGAVAAAALVLAPLVSWESVGASSDLAMTFWLIAAAVSLAAFAARPAPGLALAAGLFAGLAVTFKIVAGIYIVPLTAVFLGLLLTASRRRPSIRLAEAGLFAAGGLVAGAPWLLLRLVQTGNPVFPLYNNVFKSDKWPPVQEKFDLWLYGIGHGLGDLGRVWWDVALDPQLFGQWHPSWAIGLPVLAGVAGLAYLPHFMRDRSGLALVGVTGLGALAWFYLSQYHRYGLPAFALMALLGGAALSLALRELPQRLSVAAGAALLCVWFAAGSGISFVMSRPDPFPAGVVFGREDRDTYRERAIPDYEALLFLNEQTRATGEAAGLLGYPYNYFVLSPVYDSILPAEISPFRRVAVSGLPPDAMASALLDAGIHWLLIDYRPPPGVTVWPPDWLAQGLLSEAFLSAHAQTVYEKQDVVVYRIVAHR